MTTDPNDLPTFDPATVMRHLADMDARIERLEAWTRNEIFARTAMDEPWDDTRPAVPSDRELIARAIILSRLKRNPPTVLEDYEVADDADAVLTALGDRLLPVIPEWVSGVTVADAIRNALEGEAT
jgi:hypothetical protein